MNKQPYISFKLHKITKTRNMVYIFLYFEFYNNVYTLY